MGDVGEAPSDSAQAGTVAEQDPQAGTSVKRETPVSITLSSGPEQVSVPDLAGLSLTEAERALFEAGLKLGRRDETPSDTVPSGMVIEQNPAKGEEVEPGTAVGVVVSAGPLLRAPAVQAAPPVYDEKEAEKRQQEAEKQREKQQQEAEKQREKQQEEEEKRKE